MHRFAHGIHTLRPQCNDPSLSAQSFGLPIIVSSSSCNFVVNASCSATSSVAIVEGACIGKSSCTLVANEITFGAFKCVNHPRILAFGLDCAPTDSTLYTSTPTATPVPVPQLAWLDLNDTLW